MLEVVPDVAFNVALSFALNLVSDISCDRALARRSRMSSLTLEKSARPSSTLLVHKFNVEKPLKYYHAQLYFTKVHPPYRWVGFGIPPCSPQSLEELVLSLTNSFPG